MYLCTMHMQFIKRSKTKQQILPNAFATQKKQQPKKKNEKRTKMKSEKEKKTTEKKAFAQRV